MTIQTRHELTDEGKKERIRKSYRKVNFFISFNRDQNLSITLVNSSLIVQSQSGSFFLLFYLSNMNEREKVENNY